MSEVFQTYDPPLYFVTFNTLHRRKIPRLDRIHAAFLQYTRRAAEDFSVAVGCYVLLPDHVLFFVRGGPEFVLKSWVAGLKRAMTLAAKINAEDTALWQPGFFDHILRNDESYSEKWNYVRGNPVRHGLADAWDQWPYQGEIVYIDRA